MILRQMMLDSLQGMALPVQGIAPAAEKAKGGDPVFGDILSSVKANKKSETTPAEPSVRTRQKAENETSESQPEAKTFRDIQNEIRYEARKSQVRTTGKAAADTSINDKAPVKDTDKDINNGELEKVINCFAQALGLNPGEFRQLLKAADIAPEELAAATDVEQLASKLSEVLGLNADQSKTLGDLLELVKTQVQAAVGPDVPTIQTAETNPVNTSAEAANPAKNTEVAPEIEVVRVQNNPDSEFSALMAKLKLKLNEIQDKLKNNKEGFIEEISLQLKPVPGEADDSSTAKNEIQAATGTDGIETAKVDITAVKTDDKQNSADPGENKSDGKTDESGVKAAVEATVTAVNDDQPQVTTPVTAQVQKSIEAGQVLKTDVRTPVQAKEIINQVLEKAKVVLTGDKSEMVMDLKPDSLGKLSLKVVTENGIVMAKFVAENQQVKQVLETNMQLLRDSLEKQGMNVQGFSVSVRQDSQQGYRGQNEAGSSGRTALQRTVLNTERLMTAVEGFAAMESRNPYSNWGTSTVNYTA